jgi:carboxyl-terminal processing protease
LRDGEALRLTTARYYTPSGATIHEQGIEPHVDVVMTPEEDGKVRVQRARDRQLQTARDVLRAAHLMQERLTQGASGSKGTN